MRFDVSIAFAAALIFSGCATADQNQATAAAQEQLAAADAEPAGKEPSPDQSQAENAAKASPVVNAGEEKKVCKYIETTGSRFGRKICATPSEWEQMRKDAKDAMNDVQRSGKTNCTEGGLC